MLDAAVFADTRVSADLTLESPGGVEISRDLRDTTGGIGDLYPTFSLRWNHGVHNAMWYATGGVPVGDYEVGRLANIGINH